ncbi:TraC family protein [Rickettsiaceae bacterium]|nr:TraC family protein [Rickettsiaceae bacterium]
MLAKEIHKDFQRERLAPHFVYESYDKETGIFFNRNSLGFVLIANPLAGASITAQGELADYIASSENLPDGSTLQVLMTASSDISFLLNRWSNERCGEVYKEMALKRSNFLKKKALEDGLIKDSHILISVTIPDLSESPLSVEHMIESLKATLSAIGLFCDSVDDHLLLSILRKLWGSDNSLGVEVNPMQSISSQILQSDFSIFEDDDIVHVESSKGDESFICLEASGRPSNWNLSLMDLFLGNEARRGEYIASDYMIHTCIHILKNQSASKLSAFTKREAIGKNIRSGLGKFFPDLQEEGEDMNAAVSSIQGGDRVVQIHSNIIFKGKKEKVKQVAKSYASFMRRSGWRFAPTKYNHLSFMLASLPMMFVEGADGGFSKEQTGVGVALSKMNFGKLTVSSEIKALLPIVGEYKGDLNAPGLLLTGRRGQLKYFSQFGSELVPHLSGGTGGGLENYNMCIGGISGSGKSVLMEEIMLSTLGLGGKVFVLDHGKSFKKICKELNGNHIDCDPSRPISINPFSNVPTGTDRVSTEARADFLAYFPITLSTMAAPKEGTSDLQQSFLSQALREVWNQKQTKTEIDDIADWLLNHETETAKNLGRMLFNYTSEGAYGGFFKGKAEVTLDADIVVIETDHMRNSKDLMAVVIQIMTTHINNTMAKGRTDKPNLLVFDEMKKTLKSPLALEFVDEVSRTVRKYNASVIVATQLITDFTTQGEKAESIFEGASFKIIMNQKPETLSKMRSIPIFKDYVSSDALLRRMQSVESKKGEYSEFTLWGGGVNGDICQLRLDPFTLLMMSTNSTDKQMLADHRANGKSLKEAINCVLEERGQL